MRIVRKLLNIGAFSWIFILIIWQVVSMFSLPEFLPGPLAVMQGLESLLASGTFGQFVGISLIRILAGWIIGSAIGIPIGILMGCNPIVRALIDPILNFFRFIPAIGFLTLFMLWLGVGEESKVVLLVYATAFLVILNTMAGVASVQEEKIRAAKSLGASGWQIVFHVVIPSAIPSIFTGERLAIGSAFGAIVSAEMLAANQGIGYLIWTSRLYFKTSWIFVGLITLGVLGFIVDRLLLFLAKKALGKYGISSSIDSMIAH